MQVVDVLLQLPEPQSAELMDAIEFDQLARPEVNALLRRLASEPLTVDQVGFRSELLRRLIGMLVNNENMPGRRGTFWWEVPLSIIPTMSTLHDGPTYHVGSQSYRIYLFKIGKSPTASSTSSFHTT